MTENGKQKQRIRLGYAGALLLVCILLIYAVSGCAAPMYSKGTADMAYYEEAAPAAAPAPPMETAADRGIGNTAMEMPPPGAGGQRYIIQHAYIYLEIRDIDESIVSLQNLTDQAGGYVSSREIYTVGEERRAGSVSLRVPAGRFAPLLSGIKDLGKWKNERVYTDDVTMQYIDLDARITNLAAQEKRLRELLEKAESIEDILQVEKELGRIRGDLEAMEGSFRYLSERVQYSAIEIQLEEKDPRTLLVEDKLGSFGERLTSLMALNTNRFLTGLTNFVIVAIGSLPIILPLLLIAFLLRKGVLALRRARSRKKMEQENKQQNLGQSQ